ncbi:MAG TPA: translocation/assembly module TamB domain-containing protein, partial [Opitutaceae bacterium]|nr:translocation/assembly module TamB domain-containing protein [Opitutaceae bacterium]
ANVHVTAKRAEVDTPVLWLWRHWRAAPTNVVVGDWRVNVTKSTAAPSAPGSESGWGPLRETLVRVGAQLDRWLPRAQAGHGIVSWPGGELTLASATWSKRSLAVEDLAFRTLTARGTLVFPEKEMDAMKLAIRLRDDTGGLALESTGAKINGTFTWWQQDAKLTATFEPRGWVPTEASLQAEEWSVPGARLKLGEAYATVRGRGRIDWNQQQFLADVTVNGEPVAEKKAPPLEVGIKGRGDTTAFTVEALNAILPGITARLTEPVVVERSGRIRESAARFAVQADLAKQPWFDATGVVSGEARVASTVAANPRVEFQLQARDVAAKELALTSVETKGEFEWPRVQISGGTIVGGDGEQLRFKGGWDFRGKEILDTLVDGQIRRRSLARWLPKQPEFDVVELHAEARGPLATFEHSGKAKAEKVKFSGVNAADVTLDWRGNGLAVETFSTRAVTGASTLQAAGTIDRSGAVVRELALTQNQATLLRLTMPATVRWSPAMHIEALRLAGPEGAIDGTLTWAEAGRIEIAARNVSSQWLADFVPPKGPPWKLNLLAITGQWERGPMTFSITGGASVDLADKHVATVNVAARGNKDGLRIEALRATESEATVINATGVLPVTLHPRGAEFLRIDQSGTLQLEASAAPNAMFWQQLAEATGFELKAPDAALHVTGTWQRPQGDVRLKAQRVAIDAKRYKREFPTIEALDVHVTGDRAGVTLDTFAFTVEGQAVRAHGRLPIPDDKWEDLFKNPLAWAERGADVRLEVPDADVAVFARFLPAVLAPKGRLQLDVNYKAGGLGGFVRLRDAATRPLGPLGVLQEVTADLALAGRKLELHQVGAKSGGQPVTLTGTVELPPNGAPRYDLVLKGDNLPFVRQTGLLVRGDLDLKLQSTADAKSARISGVVRLRDSLFLQDVRAFLPRGGGGGSGTRRPPYFEVNTPPVNTWTLAVDVVGERFLRLRTPVFTGVASARFRLGGTLGEPRAIGEVAIDEGQIRMPFASFRVAQGSVRLTEASPYEPTIYVRGTGRRLGYDLAMEIEGTGGGSPSIVFSSSPALDSEQVLLMIMTGAAPSNTGTHSGTQRVAQIGAYLGQSLLGSLGTDVADADKLTIVAGEKVSPQGKENYEVEYKLSDRWAVIGEKTELDEFNAGLKWRVFPRATAEEKRKKAEAESARK